MKRFKYSPLLLISLVFLCACGRSYSGKLQPTAKEGVLDLRGWDFEKDGPVDLKGEWDFYWKQLLQAQDFARESQPPRTGLFKMPMIWNEYQLPGKTFPGHGYATYRLRVHLDPGRSSLSLRIPTMSGAYNLYLNQALLGSRGRVASNRARMKPQWLPQVVSFRNPGEPLTLYLQISNFQYRDGGPWDAIKLGTKSFLKNEREKNIALVLFLSGSLIVIGLYHLGIFFQRRKEKPPLFFALFCILLALRSLVTGERFLIYVFSQAPWEFFLKIEYLTFYLSLPVFVSFLNGVLPGLFNKGVHYLIWLLGGCFGLLIVFTPADVYGYSLEIYQLISGVSILYMLYLVILAFLRKMDGAGLFFLSSILLSFSSINDMLFAGRYIRTGELLPYGLFVFVFFQAYFLSTKSSHAFNAVEALTDELETKVHERTQEAEAGREQLEGLRDVFRQVSGAGNLSFVLTAVQHALVEHMGPLAVWLLLVDKEQGELYMDSYRPIPGTQFTEAQIKFMDEFRLPLKPESGALYGTYKKRRTFLLEHIGKRRLNRSPIDREITEIMGFTSIAHRALVVQNEVIGILCVNGQGTIRRRYLKWLELFAVQTAGAVHAAGLLARAESARGDIQELNRLSRRINQSTDVDVVLEDVFAYFQKQFRIEGYAVYLHDPGPNELYILKYSEVMRRFDAERRAGGILRFPLEPSSGSLFSTFHRRKPFYMRDLRRSLKWGKMGEIDRLINETLGFSGILQVPLIIQEQSIGIICLLSLEKRMELSKADIRSIERTCDQISGAIYRSFLYKQVRQASEKAEQARHRLERAQGELIKLNQFAIKINESTNLDGILRDIFAFFNAEFNIDSVIVQLVDRKTNELYTYHTSETAWVSQEKLDFARKFRVPLGHEGGMIYKTFQRQKPFYAWRITERFYERAGPILQELMDKLEFRSFLMVPLVIQNKTIGLVLCSSYPRPFRVNKTEIDTIYRFCEQIAGAIYSSSLFKQLEENTFELALVNDSLKKMDRAKTRFFSNISHAFRTPLTLILAPLESIVKGDFGESISNDNATFKPILRNGRRLLRLINNLLDFTKIEAGRMTTHKQKTDMLELLEFYILSLRSDAERRGLHVSIKSNTEDRFAYIDRKLMEKAIMNLLSNAFKFTAPGGEVILQLDNIDDSHFSLSVQDSGIGVPEDKLNSIFERFSQGDELAAREHEGTGIGLSLTREIIELHGGDISVESNPGEGTAFRIMLPRGEEAAPVKGEETLVLEELDPVESFLDLGGAPAQELEEAGAESILDTEQSEKHKILLVEDDEDMRAFLKLLLKREYIVFSAANGVEGEAKARDLGPDLILSDVMMPGRDGYEMTRNLKQARETRDIPVILLSARADISHRLEGLEFGADDYLSKPFNAEELMARIRNQIESKNLERDLKKKKTIRDKDFKQAALVQKSILTPREVYENIPDLDIEVLYLPMNGVVSGDYYNISQREEDITSVFIGDATGHGTQAALSTMQIDMLYRENLAKKYPDEAFELINRKFVSELHSKNYFTGFIVDILKDKILYSSAGHPEQYLIRAGDKKIQKLRTKGWMIGIREEQHYEMAEVPLEKGDILLLFSDGVYEVFNSAGEEFGEERFFKLIQDGVLSGLGELPMGTLIESILNSLDEFRNETPFRDDITLIGIRLK